MIEVFLPDGSSRQLPEGATGLDLANSVGRRLAQDAVAIRVNEQLSDIYLELPNQAQIEIVTQAPTVRYKNTMDNKPQPQ